MVKPDTSRHAAPKVATQPRTRKYCTRTAPAPPTGATSAAASQQLALAPCHAQGPRRPSAPLPACTRLDASCWAPAQTSSAVKPQPARNCTSTFVSQRQQSYLFRYRGGTRHHRLLLPHPLQLLFNGCHLQRVAFLHARQARRHNLPLEHGVLCINVCSGISQCATQTLMNDTQAECFQEK